MVFVVGMSRGEFSLRGFLGFSARERGVLLFDCGWDGMGLEVAGFLSLSDEYGCDCSEAVWAFFCCAFFTLVVRLCIRLFTGFGRCGGWG